MPLAFQWSRRPHLATLRPQLRADDLDDIADPIGREPEVYAEVAEQIAAVLQAMPCSSSAGASRRDTATTRAPGT